ncbi:hypothetical protein ACFFRR_002139 [Megaselia abdita]
MHAVLPNETSSLPSDGEDEGNNEFTGATLKISSFESPDSSLRFRGVDLNSSSVMESSAILTGLDDPMSPVATKKPKESVELPKYTTTASAEYFSLRPGQFEKAVNDCVNTMLRPAGDTDVQGSWLLTEVSHWDHERERIIVLTTKTLLIVKYDFIALKSVQHTKVRLDKVDTVLDGRLTYPSSSLVPRIEGITNGFTSLICGRLFSKVAPANPVKSARRRNSFPQTCRLTVANRFDFTTFHPVEKKEFGVRVMWNKDVPEDFEKNRTMYSVDSFNSALKDIFSNSNPESINFNCDFKEGPILMENYIGIGAVIHNKNNFGFFKVRGKFSF